MIAAVARRDRRRQHPRRGGQRELAAATRRPPASRCDQLPELQIEGARRRQGSRRRSHQGDVTCASVRRSARDEPGDERQQEPGTLVAARVDQVQTLCCGRCRRTTGSTVIWYAARPTRARAVSRSTPRPERQMPLGDGVRDGLRRVPGGVDADDDECRTLRGRRCRSRRASIRPSTGQACLHSESRNVSTTVPARACALSVTRARVDRAGRSAAPGAPPRPRSPDRARQGARVHRPRPTTRVASRHGRSPIPTTAAAATAAGRASRQATARRGGE